MKRMSEHTDLISSLSLLLVQTQAARWKAATPEQLTGAHLYIDYSQVRLPPSCSWECYAIIGFDHGLPCRAKNMAIGPQLWQKPRPSALVFVYRVPRAMFFTWHGRPWSNPTSHARWSMGWSYLSIPKRQRLHCWSLGMDKWFHPRLYNGWNYFSMLGLMLNHVSEGGGGGG